MMISSIPKLVTASRTATNGSESPTIPSTRHPADSSSSGDSELERHVGFLSIRIPVRARNEQRERARRPGHPGPRTAFRSSGVAAVRQAPISTRTDLEVISSQPNYPQSRAWCHTAFCSSAQPSAFHAPMARRPCASCRTSCFGPSLRCPGAATVPTIASIVPPPRGVRSHWREAVGISVLSAGFKTLPVWLEISFRVIVGSCLCRRR
jgi:hypothetical protein